MSHTSRRWASLRGGEGVFRRTADYFNPFFAALRDGRMSGPPVGPLRTAAAPVPSAAGVKGGH